MEGLTAFSIGGRLPLRFPSTSRKHRSFISPPPASSLPSSRFRCGSELDKWDQMELKFGRLLGEDPKLTLAKIMARKANPNVSYLEVEKSFHKNKGKLDESMFNMPADLNVERQSSDDYAKTKNLNLVFKDYSQHEERSESYC